jgi:hypothetical protein
VKKHRVMQIVVGSLVCVAMVFPPAEVSACGPFFKEAVFTYTKHPDLPLDRYAAGELGILQPTFARSYLVVAYRYLTGKNLSPAEQSAVLSLWQERLSAYSAYDSVTDEDSTPAEDAWFKARAKVPGIRPLRSGKDLRRTDKSGYWNYIQASQYDSNLNCLGPAFETATRTLRARIRQFGLTSPAIRDWVGDQDDVFAFCNGKDPTAQQHLPSQADSALPEIIRSDRAYKIASAHFYAGDYDAARELFSQINQDAKSPWRATSALMVARSIIRKATILSPNPESEAAGLRDARLVIEGILKDRSLAEMHHPAKMLRDFIDARLNAAGYAHRLAQDLAEPNNADLKHDLCDYTILLDKWLEPFDDPPYPENGGPRRRFSKSALTLLPGVIRGDPLTDWILTLQSSDDSSQVHAIQRWHETGSIAWLVAAVAKMKASDANADELLSAAKHVEPNSPAYLTVLFNVLRMEAISGRSDTARSDVDLLLQNHLEHLPRSALNLFLGLRMSLAQSLDEFLSDAPRVPALIDDGEDEIELPDSRSFIHETKNSDSERVLNPEFDVDGAWVFTRSLPTLVLIRAVESKTLPPPLRSAVANSAWVRAIESDDAENALRLAPIVADLDPKLSSEMRRYVVTTDPASRRFSGVLTILRTPGLRPFVGYGVRREAATDRVDSYRDNWWCNLSDSHVKSWEAGDFWSDLYSPIQAPDKLPPVAEIYQGGRFAAPPFLSAEERAAAEKEWGQLLKAGIGTTWLAEQALAWANAHPTDPLTPEALHLAVRAMRYGCDSGDSSKLSHEAFNLLHRRYPNSEWTKKTPYWF